MREFSSETETFTGLLLSHSDNSTCDVCTVNKKLLFFLPGLACRHVRMNGPNDFLKKPENLRGGALCPKLTIYNQI